jgi:hypothetical protein
VRRYVYLQFSGNDKVIVLFGVKMDVWKLKVQMMHRQLGMQLSPYDNP